MSEVAQAVDLRRDLEHLAPLFTYPDADFPALLARAAAAVADGDHLHQFSVAVRDIDPSELQSIYTSTFDLAPECSPYLGIHLFGEENRNRARLMVGLRAAYERCAPHVAESAGNSELPDHIAVALRFAPRFSEEEWRDLTRLVLGPALDKMHELLRVTSNPYRHLVAAAVELCTHATNGDAS